jgi:hypothetical protein
MKTTAALLLPLASLLPAIAALAWPATAHAAETRRDVETDHLDGFDDGGPRRFGLLANPLSIALGTFGAEGDLVLGDTAALSLEAGWTPSPEVQVYGAAVGVPLFPARIPFHGFYLHPRLAWWRASADGASVDVMGLGATVGWEWTWRIGFTVRAGLGATYERALAASDGPAGSLTGVRPLVDASLGWVF